MQFNPPLKSFITLLMFWHICAHAQVNATFTYNEGCNGVVTFTSARQSNTFYVWQLGDNTLDSGPVIAHQYTQQGTYTVTLNATYNGVTDTTSQQIYVGQFIQQQISGPADICVGSTAAYSLTNASANLQYTWLTAAGILVGNSHADSIQVIFNDTGTTVLSVLVTNGAGCDSMLQQTVSVHPNPNLILPSQGNDTNRLTLTVCQNDPVWYYVITSTHGNITWNSTGGTTLTAQGVDSMQFLFPNVGTTSVQISEVTPWGCSDSVSFLVNVFPTPSITASAVNACLGSDNNFTATPTPANSSFSYQWEFDDGAQATGITAAHTFATAGQHSAMVIATNANGCTDTARITTQVDVTPGPVITCVGPVCAGAQEVYTTPQVNGASYNWTVTGGTITSGGTLSDNSIGIQWGNGPVGTIQLYLTGSGIYCQTPTVDQVQIIGSGLTIQGSATPCVNTIVNYSTQLIPGGIYNWVVDPNAGSIQSGQGTNQIQVYFWTSTPTTISVNVSHEILTCTSNPSLTVTPLQPFSVYGSPSACAGVAATFSTYQTGNFNWTVQGGTIVSGNGTATISVIWGNAGTYSISASNTTGFCNTTAQTTTTVVIPTKETVQGNYQVCVASTETYFISPNESSYTWKVLSGGTIVGNTNSNSIQVTWNTAGSDTLQVIYANNNGCPDTAYYIVNVAPSSVPDFTGDTIACYGSNENFTFTPVTGVSYVWETQGAVITSGQNTGSVSVMWTGTQIGLIRLRNTACNTYLQKNIVIRPTPLINILPENLNCTGSSADLVVAQDYASYVWSNSAATQGITITTTGTYIVTVTDAFGCTASASQNENPIPSNGFTSASIYPSYPLGNSPIPYVQLNAAGVPTPTAYSWSTANNDEQFEDVDVPGTYSVTMTNQFGCTASASAVVTTVTITGTGGIGVGTTILPCNISPPIFTTNNPVCNPVQFTPAMTATHYFWDFGDNVYSYQSNPSHRFIIPGTQNVTLYYSNDGVTWYECSQSFVINGVMNISFTSAGGCKGDIDLTNTATSALPVTSVMWRLGDGNTSNTTPVLSYKYPNNASSYWVSLILTDGVCTDSVQQTVNVNELNANFTYTGVCVNNPALFNDATVHTAIISSYSWYFDNGNTADYYDPITYYTSAGNYADTLIIKDATGCLDTSIQNVPVNQFTPPTITASGPLTFCQGSSVNLSLPAGNNYYWNDAETTASIQVTQSGSFFAWAQSTTNGCSGFTDTVAVIENIPPSAYIGNPGLQTEICTGSNFNLNGLPNGATSYQWYLNGVANSTNQNQYFYYAQTGQTGNYQLVITDANGCNDTSAILHIDVNPLPATPNIIQTPSGTICAGQPVMLSVTGPDFYQWSNGVTGNSITVYQTNSYEVFATNTFGCGSYNYTYVNYSQTPDFSGFLTGCYQICPNNNITVSGPAGMQSYLWSDGETTQTITLTTSGTYSLDATATGGCSAQSDSFTVDVFSAANIQLGNDTNICSGQTVVLNAGAYPQITWQDGSTNQFYTVTDSGLYKVTVTTSAGCTSSDSVLVSVHSPTVNLGNDTTVCSPDTVLLSVSNSFTNIVWSNNSTGNTDIITQTGQYFVHVTDAWGCKAADSITVTVDTLTIQLGDDTTICSPNTLLLSAIGNFTGITWSGGSTNSTYTVVQSGSYYVTVTGGGCTATDSITVKIDTVSAFLGNDTTICSNATLQLSANGNYSSIIWSNSSTGTTLNITQAGLYYVNVTDAANCSAADSITVSTYPNTQLDSLPPQSLCDSSVTLIIPGTYSLYNWSTGSTSASITVTDTGVYYITVTDANGCTSSDSALVNACNAESPNRYYIPNVFAPNSNGPNNGFGVYIKPGSAPVEMFSMMIFDRWGEKLFESENESAIWDGKYKGKYVAQGVLTYVIKYQTAEENSAIHGTVTLLR